MIKFQKNNKRGLFIAAAVLLAVIILIILYILLFKVNFKKINAGSGASSEKAASITASFNVGSGTDAVANSAIPQGIADSSHIKNSVFIGDFVPVALGIYTTVPASNIFADVGINIANIGTKKITVSKKETTTIAAVKKRNPANIYVCVGSNDVEWREKDDVIANYTKYVRKLKAAAPNAKIYLMSITPVTSSKSNSDKNYSNKKIREFNSWILSTAKSENVYYQDVFSALSGNKDSLPNELAENDGYHIKATGYKLIMNYISSHAASGDTVSSSVSSQLSTSTAF